jgi:hypothetical protein
MSDANHPDPLIDSLTAVLTPVRRLRQRDGALLVVAASALCVGMVAALFGLRADVAALNPAAIVVARSAALLLLGMATTAAALTAARPGVGRHSRGWVWAALAAAAIPAMAMWGTINGEARADLVLGDSVPWCFGVSLTAAAVIGGAMTLWLRHGAVTEPERAGLLTGLAAGAIGTFAYNLTCPSGSVYYAGLWYSLTVLLSGGLGRMLLPRLLRW